MKYFTNKMSVIDIDEKVDNLVNIATSMRQIEDAFINLDLETDKNKQEEKRLMLITKCKEYELNFLSEVFGLIDFNYIVTKYPDECLTILAKKEPKMLDEKATELLCVVHK